MWRPKDWKNPYKEPIYEDYGEFKVQQNWINTPDAFEAGADAMLEAVYRQCAQYETVLGVRLKEVEKLWKSPKMPNLEQN